MPVSRLTVQQRYALGKLMTVAWQSAYVLQERRTTLDALVNRGMAERKENDCALFFPRTNIFYRLSGERARTTPEA